MKRILFILTAFLAVASSSFAYEDQDGIRQTVRKDRKWFYSGYLSTDSVAFLRTETVDGTEYHVYNGIGDLPYIGEEAFMREDSGRIYRYMKDSVDSVHGSGEYLLYDLNTPEGGSFQGLFFEFMEPENTVIPYIADVKVSHKSPHGLDIPGVEAPGGGGVISDYCGMAMEVEGFSIWDDANIYEEVGPAYDFVGTWTTPMLPGENSARKGYRFEYMADMDGNILCLGTHYRTIEEVEAVNPGQKSRKYDLNGREIRNPEPGTVYIQGGRKHVAPRR